MPPTSLNPQLQALERRIQEMDNSIAKILEHMHRRSPSLEALTKHPQELIDNRNLEGKKAEDRPDAVRDLSPLAWDPDKWPANWRWERFSCKLEFDRKTKLGEMTNDNQSQTRGMICLEKTVRVPKGKSHNWEKPSVRPMINASGQN